MILYLLKCLFTTTYDGFIKRKLAEPDCGGERRRAAALSVHRYLNNKANESKMTKRTQYSSKMAL